MNVFFNDEAVPAEVERDLKLMSSILGIEHYTLIMLGAITVRYNIVIKYSIRIEQL